MSYGKLSAITAAIVVVVWAATTLVFRYVLNTVVDDPTPQDDPALLAEGTIFEIGGDDQTGSYERMKNGGFPYYDECYYNYNWSYHNEVAKALSMEALKKIADAMLAYAKANDGRLPPVYSTDAQGKPLHSWRVLILPYFSGEDSSFRYLYDQIKLDEPWDSEWNRQFFDKVPYVYEPNEKGQTQVFNKRSYDIYPTKEKAEQAQEEFGMIGAQYTCYSVVVGKDTAFPPVNGEANKRQGAALFDGDPSKTAWRSALVFERVTGVCWMQPDKELTVEEIANGNYLKTQPPTSCVRTDKMEKRYIPVIGLGVDPFEPDAPESPDGYWRCLLREEIAPELVIELTKREPDLEKFKSYPKRFVRFL